MSKKLLTMTLLIKPNHRIPNKKGFLRGYLASNNLNDRNNIIVDIDRQVIHSKYHQRLLKNDIALLHTTTNMISEGNGRIVAADLPTSMQKFSGMGRVSGFGQRIKYDNRNNGLYYVDLYLNHNSMCRNEGRFYLESQICVGHVKAGKESCSGDSGGPMVQFNETTNKTIVIGLVSYGYDTPCGASYRTVEVHTKVSAFVNWIKKYVQI